MRDELARAFQILLMSRSELERLYAVERTLPYPQSLGPYQITRAFRSRPRKTLISVDEIHAMESCWALFYKTVLGPQQAYEDSIHPEGCTMFTCTHPWDDRCKTKAQEMAQWDAFVMSHYKTPAQRSGTLEEAFGGEN